MEGLGLTRYSYPALTDLPHYGDWQAQFENESLAYYEKYTEKSYGFAGGQYLHASKPTAPSPWATATACSTKPSRRRM